MVSSLEHLPAQILVFGQCCHLDFSSYKFYSALIIFTSNVTALIGNDKIDEMGIIDAECQFNYHVLSQLFDQLDFQSSTYPLLEINKPLATNCLAE